MISISRSWSASRGRRVRVLYVRALTLALACGLLFTQLIAEWSGADGKATELAREKEAQLVALRVATASLRGIETDSRSVRRRIDLFYLERLPSRYSEISHCIGELEAQSGVHISEIVYSQRAPHITLTEIAITSGVSGNYYQIMNFISGLERNHTFFLIRAMTLTGQEDGKVSLRLRFSTWIRSSKTDKFDNAPLAGSQTASQSMAIGKSIVGEKRGRNDSNTSWNRQ